MYILTEFILNFNMNSIAVHGKVTIGKLIVLIAMAIGTRGLLKFIKAFGDIQVYELT